MIDFFKEIVEFVVKVIFGEDIIKVSVEKIEKLFGEIKVLEVGEKKVIL